MIEIAIKEYNIEKIDSDDSCQDIIDDCFEA